MGEELPHEERVAGSSFDLGTGADAFQHTGRGFQEYPNGTLYEGELQKGIREGFGVCYYASGNIFVGQFHKGVMCGEGTMFFQCGDLFSGEFRDGSIYKGMYISQKGIMVRGVWGLGGCNVLVQAEEKTEMVSRRHLELCSAVLRCVHQHFLKLGKQDNAFPRLPSGGDPSSLPVDILPCTLFKRSAPSHGDSFHRNQSSPQCSGPVALPKHTTANRFGLDDICAEVDKDFLGAELTQSSTPEAIFACSAPVCNEYFRLRHYQLRCFVFLFPFLSLPAFFFSPLRITTLPQEREFVVSGATLRRDFDPPGLSIYAIALAVCCQVIAIVLATCKVELGSAREGYLTLSEMVIPCILWLVLALFCAAYHSYFRYPHCLERMDRQLTHKLSAFAASVIDARAKVCIYTCDEEGQGKVMNHHYNYRWLFFALIGGAAMSLSAPLTRLGFGKTMYGQGFEVPAALLAFIATFFFTTTLVYYILKITDMRRELVAKLRVLSELAFVERRSITNPSAHLRQMFNLDAPLNLADLFSGFPGWYASRSLILYGSTSSNHASQSAAMSIFALLMLSVNGLVIADVFYMLAEHKNNSRNYYSTTHSYGIVVTLLGGIALWRYLYACASARNELKHHLYIMDIASMYHLVKLRHVEGSEVIKHCREMAAAHDAYPQWFNFPLPPLLGCIFVYLNFGALAALGYQLSQVISN